MAHLAGLYMCKNHDFELELNLEGLSFEKKSEDYIEDLREKSKYFCKKYRQYGKKVGFEKSCHVLRD